MAYDIATKIFNPFKFRETSIEIIRSLADELVHFGY